MAGELPTAGSAMAQSTGGTGVSWLLRPCGDVIPATRPTNLTKGRPVLLACIPGSPSSCFSHYYPPGPCYLEKSLLPPSPDPTRHHVVIGALPGASSGGSWRQRRRALEGHNSTAWGRAKRRPREEPPSIRRLEAGDIRGAGCPEGNPSSGLNRFGCHAFGSQAFSLPGLWCDLPGAVAPGCGIVAFQADQKRYVCQQSLTKTRCRPTALAPSGCGQRLRQEFRGSFGLAGT